MGEKIDLDKMPRSSIMEKGKQTVRRTSLNKDLIRLSEKLVDQNETVLQMNKLLLEALATPTMLIRRKE